jgi:hypothetical protein
MMKGYRADKVWEPPTQLRVRMSSVEKPACKSESAAADYGA